MTQPGRSGPPRRGGRNANQLAFGALVLLAVGGSVVMVFTDSAQLLRLAVVALLWVAVVCSIAVTKYRKEAATSASRAQELQKVYELELEREVNARREHELLVERDVREQVHTQVRAESTDDLAGLRAEVKALRESLSELFNGDFLVERIALRAESTECGRWRTATRRRSTDPSWKLRTRTISWTSRPRRPRSTTRPTPGAGVTAAAQMTSLLHPGRIRARTVQVARCRSCSPLTADRSPVDGDAAPRTDPASALPPPPTLHIFGVCAPDPREVGQLGADPARYLSMSPTTIAKEPSATGS